MNQPVQSPLQDTLLSQAPVSAYYSQDKTAAVNFGIHSLCLHYTTPQYVRRMDWMQSHHQICHCMKQVCMPQTIFSLQKGKQILPFAGDSLPYQDSTTMHYLL